MANVIDKLKVTEEAFETAIKDFDTKKIALQSCYTKIHTSAYDLQSVWKGEANTAFLEKFSEMYKNVEATEQVMDNIIDRLRRALTAYQEKEQEIQSMYESSEVGRLFLS